MQQDQTELARSIYAEATTGDKEKALLIKLFGEGIKPKDITGLIKTFEDACAIQNLKTHGDAYKLLKLDRVNGADIPIEQCDDDLLKAMIIVRGLNEGWWPAKGEKRWFPIYDTNHSSGFGFSCSDYDDWYARTLCGSRLGLRYEKLSNYMGVQFTPLFKNILIVE